MSFALKKRRMTVGIDLEKKAKFGIGLNLISGTLH